MKKLLLLLVLVFVILLSCSEREIDIIYKSQETINNEDSGGTEDEEDSDNNDDGEEEGEDNDDDDDDDEDEDEDDDDDDEEEEEEEEEEEDEDDDDDEEDDAKVAIIGDDYVCGSSITATVPARYNGYGTNSWSVVLYRAIDINHLSGGVIKKISYLIDCKTTACESDPVFNQKIYIKQVSQSSINSSSLPDLNSMTKVFDGSITWKAGTSIETSWNDVTLDTSFSYDGLSNLLIYFENTNNAVVGGFMSCTGETPSFLWDNLGNDRSLSATFNSNPANPASTPVLGNFTPITKLTFQ